MRTKRKKTKKEMIAETPYEKVWYTLTKLKKGGYSLIITAKDHPGITRKVHYETYTLSYAEQIIDVASEAVHASIKNNEGRLNWTDVAQACIYA